MVHPVNNGPDKINADLRHKITNTNLPPQPRKPKKAAEILPFPSIRQCALCDDELVNVMNWNKDARDRWLVAVVRRHKRRLKKLGVESAKIDADVRALEIAFGLVRDKVA
jgi:hypothetical protein